MTQVTILKPRQNKKIQENRTPYQASCSLLIKKTGKTPDKKKETGQTAGNTEKTVSLLCSFFDNINTLLPKKTGTPRPGRVFLPKAAFIRKKVRTNQQTRQQAHF